MPSPAVESPTGLRGDDKPIRTARPASANGHAHSPIPLFESSPTFQMAVRQLQSVAGHIDLDPGVLARLRQPKRALVVSVPIRMDAGHTESFIGFRVQHSLTSGPAKG